MCICHDIWHGEYCEKKHCADWNNMSDAPECTGHGTCVLGTCLCATGWGKDPLNATKDPLPQI
jgi:hypothetical protein